MSTPRRHHYLPRFYLEGFARDRCFWIYDRELREYRKQTPENTAVGRDYYTIVTQEKTTRNDIEYFFSQIEGETKPIVERVDEGKPINVDDRAMLSSFVGFLKLRTPVFEATFNLLSEEMVKRVAERVVASPQDARKILEEESRSGRQSDFTPEKLFEFVRKGEYTIDTHRNMSLLAVLQVGLQNGVAISTLDWVIGHCGSETSFVTSDNPVVLISGRRHTAEKGVGILTPGVGKVVALNQRTCLVALDRGGRLSHMEMSRKQVRDLNLAITQQCGRLVIGRDEQLVRNLVKTTRVDLTVPPRRFLVT